MSRFGLRDGAPSAPVGAQARAAELGAANLPLRRRQPMKFALRTRQTSVTGHVFSAAMRRGASSRTSPIDLR
jgi:hypothetical protein